MERRASRAIGTTWPNCSDHPIGQAALTDRGLLREVVIIKSAFYNRTTSRYDECDSGAMRLVPSEAGLEALRLDYEKMIDSGMFRGEAPTFDWVMVRVRALEATINA